MKGEDFADVLTTFKRRESAEDIIPILANDDIQKLIVAWPKIVLKRAAVKEPCPRDLNEQWQWLWKHVGWCEKEYQEISGVAEAKFRRLFNQVKGNRLIYPDDSVSSHAAKYLNNLSMAATARLKTELPKVKGAEFRIAGLSDLCGKVVVAASTDQYRYNLNSVFFDLKKCRIVATDGHRLHYEPVEKAGPCFSLPREAASLMVKHSCSDEFTLADEFVSVALAGGVMTAKLKGQDFPDYERVLVEEQPVKVAFKALDLLKVLEGALPMVDAGGSDKGINLVINGRMVIRSQSPGLGNYKWHIGCTTEGKNVKELVIGINAKYLIDAVRSFAVSDNVVLEIHDPMSPFLVNKKALIMPMRVN